MRTAAAHVRVDWLVITMAVLMMGGCSRLGGGTYSLEVHNRTTVPIKLAPSSWSSGDTIVLACESATFIWGRGSAANQSGSMPAPDGVTIEVPVSMSPPPIQAATGRRR